MSPEWARISATSTRSASTRMYVRPCSSIELLALFGDGADAGGREKAAQTGAAAAHHLGERALRRGHDLETALVHRLADLGRGAHVAGDDPV